MIHIISKPALYAVRTRLSWLSEKLAQPSGSGVSHFFSSFGLSAASLSAVINVMIFAINALTAEEYETCIEHPVVRDYSIHDALSKIKNQKYQKSNNCCNSSQLLEH